MSLIYKLGLELLKMYQNLIKKLDSLKGSPVSIAKGFATGVAMSFTPFVGFHLLLSVLVAKIFHQNSIASTLGTIAGNPWTFPFIWYTTLNTGFFLLGQDGAIETIDFKQLFSKMFHTVISLDFKLFLQDIWPIFYPMLVGAIPIYIIVWWLTYKAVKNTLSKK